MGFIDDIGDFFGFDDGGGGGGGDEDEGGEEVEDDSNFGAIAASIIGAGASIFSGKQASDAAGEAARIQGLAAAQALDENKRQFEISSQDIRRELAQARRDTESALTVSREQLQPFRDIGLGALEQQQALLGLGPQGAQDEALDTFVDSPGQQFLRRQQERALKRNAASIGQLGGGNVKTALQEQAFNRANTQLTERFNQLGVLSGTGRAAGGQIGQQAITGAGGISQLGAAATGGLANLGSVSSGNIANLISQGAAARASGILGAQQATSQGLQGAAGFLGQIFNPQPQASFA